MKDKLKEIQNITYFTKGHRGLLYRGDYKKKKVVIKTERKDSKAIGRIENDMIINVRDRGHYLRSGR